MRQQWQISARLRELWPIFFVAVAVAVFSTAAGSVFDHVHQVDAEELTAAEVTATPTGEGMQTINVADWGVSLTLPLAQDMPAVRYTTRSGGSVGLSSIDLEKMGPACLASRSGLGSLVRLPGGNFADAVHGNPAMHFIATINNYDYVYYAAQNACTDQPGASTIVNREESAIFASLDTLAAAVTQ
jgi:hypothetical protein